MPIHSILIVDDDPDTRGAMRKILTPLKYAISAASSGREAIKLLNGETFDLVITDILMPDGDGFALIAALRKHFPSIRIIAISGGGPTDSSDNCLSIAQGFLADGILKKPLTRDGLVKAIKEVGMNSPAHA